MRNRAIQVKMVKMDEEEKSQPKSDEPPPIAYISSTIDSVVEKIAFGVCAYVVLDTLRQVIVEKAKSPGY